MSAVRLSMSINLNAGLNQNKLKSVSQLSKPVSTVARAKIAPISSATILLAPKLSVKCPSISERTAPNSSGADAGQITSDLIESMKEKLCEALQTTDVEIIDANGDGRHVSIHAVSSIFAGKSAVKRQRMVYKAIWQELSGTVHAVDEMTTLTPEEVASGKTDI